MPVQPSSPSKAPADTRVSGLLRLYSLIGIGFFALFAALMFARGRLDIALGCTAGGALLLLNLLLGRAIGRVRVSSLLLIFIGGAGILWVIAHDLSRTSPYFWVPFFSMVPFFLLGQVRGLLAALVFAVPVLGLALATHADPVVAEHDPVFLARFGVSLVGTLAFAFIFERSRSRSQQDHHRELAARRSIAAQLEEANHELSESLSKVKLLSGFLPICAHCKKIRDDKGYWNQLEAYITEHSEAQFSHGLCDPCARRLYGAHATAD